MKKIIKIYSRLVLLPAMFFILPNVGTAQVFSAEAPNIVAVGEVFNYTLVVNGQGQITSVPNFPSELEQRGTSQTSSNINGKITVWYNFTLYAKQEGKFTIGEATMVDASGNTLKTKPITIEVIKGQAAQQNSANNGVDIFIRIIPSRTSLYRGDKLTVTLKAYYSITSPQMSVAGARTFKVPSFDGFWATPIENIDQKTVRENINGKIYETQVLKAWTLSPQKSGALQIEPADIMWIIHKRVRLTIFMEDTEESQKQTKSPSLTINVKDMPSGAPASFTGAVGSYTMTASLSKNNVTANDAVSLNVKISGNGNFSLIGAPQLKLPPDFDTYDSKKTLTANSVNFEYYLIPRSAGTFTIEPVVFSYFNPADEYYRTITSNPMVIDVEKDLNSQQQVTFVNPTNQRDVQILASDIRFIKNKPETWHAKGSRFLGLKHFYTWYIISGIMFLLIYLFLRKKNKEAQNIVLMRNRKAKGIAKKRLKVAEKSMKLNNAANFYDELLKAIWGYLGDKYLIPVAELSRNNVSELLAEKCVEQKYIEQLINIVDECEYARYAPGASSSQMHSLYDNTIEVVSKLEQKTK
ncbi:MAG: BatD family protein [Prevotellaceae bacterium]|jgi:hypothetical protein|nr:BatD family protein [Prevotellaceae bacterium]